MRAIVNEVISELVIELDQRWTFHDMQGSRVKINGILPGAKSERSKNRTLLTNLIKGKLIIIEEFFFVSDDTVVAFISYNGKLIQDHFPDRKIPTIDPSRWIEPDESELIEKVFGGIPTSRKNPLQKLALHDSAFWDNLNYPTKYWDKNYEQNRKLADSLYSDTHGNKEELDRWFEMLLTNPRREAPLLLHGDVGIGKSWWIAYKLMHLTPAGAYHPILIDLRYCRRGKNLEESIEAELNDFLNYYIRDLSWMYPDYLPHYGKDFDPHNPGIIDAMRKQALGLSPSELLQKRLRFYNNPDAPELIVVFDNIDHFKEEEQTVVIDICARLIGNAAGVKVVIVIRPTTRLKTSRSGAFFGEALTLPVKILSPEVFDVIYQRITHNYKGDVLNPNKKIPSTHLTLVKILEIYRKSDHVWGLAGFVRELCTTEKIRPENSITKTEKDRSTYQCSYDVRHYLKLFRRILRSDCLSELENIGNTYYGIHSLLLRDKEPMSGTDAYLFNLFDNENPEMRGNALIRYRVLEYCKLFKDLGDVFKMYFQALGCGVEVALSVLDLFDDANLIDIETIEDVEGNKIPIRAKLTIPGKRHLEVVTNLWYIISIKTGMHIYKNLILWGEKALLKASQFVSSDERLTYYAEHGWVSEENFIDFLGMQELLETRRIGVFQESHPEWKKQVANMAGKMSSPAENVYYSYHTQIKYWQSYRRKEATIVKEEKGE